MAQDPRYSKKPDWLQAFLIAMIWSIFTTIAQPLFARWLEQQDAEKAAAKAAAQVHAQVQTQRKPLSRFKDFVVVKVDGLALRKGPRTTYPLMTTLKQGQMLHVLKKSGLWARVDYTDMLHAGVSYTGWIKLKQTQPVEDETLRLIWCELTGGHADDAAGCDAE